MKLTLEIPDDMGQGLVKTAEVNGVDASAFVVQLLENAVPEWKAPLTKEEADDFLRVMSQFSRKIPHLPDEALTRESMYRDR